MTAIERYRRFFESLDRAALQRLDEYFTADARFCDPFNDVRGIDAIRQVFQRLYNHCAEAEFEVDEAMAEGSVGYLRWRMHFRLKGERAARLPIAGVSRVVLAADGRICEHVDYWDAAGQLYAQFPVVGTLMRWLGRRVGGGAQAE